MAGAEKNPSRAGTNYEELLMRATPESSGVVTNAVTNPYATADINSFEDVNFGNLASAIESENKDLSDEELDRKKYKTIVDIAQGLYDDSQMSEEEYKKIIDDAYAQMTPMSLRNGAEVRGELPIIDMLGGAVDTVNNGIGTAIDGLYDNTLGLALDTALKTDTRNAFSGEDLSFIPLIAEQTALSALGPAGMAGAVGLGALASRDDFARAATGRDTLTQRDLSDEQKSASLFSGILNSALGAIPGAGKTAAKAAEAAAGKTGAADFALGGAKARRAALESDLKAQGSKAWDDLVAKGGEFPEGLESLGSLRSGIKGSEQTLKDLESAEKLKDINATTTANIKNLSDYATEEVRNLNQANAKLKKAEDRLAGIQDKRNFFAEQALKAEPGSTLNLDYMDAVLNLNRKERGLQGAINNLRPKAQGPASIRDVSAARDDVLQRRAEQIAQLEADKEAQRQILEDLNLAGRTAMEERALADAIEGQGKNLGEGLGGILDRFGRGAKEGGRLNRMLYGDTDRIAGIERAAAKRNEINDVAEAAEKKLAEKGNNGLARKVSEMTQEEMNATPTIQMKLTEAADNGISRSLANLASSRLGMGLINTGAAGANMYADTGESPLTTILNLAKNGDYNDLALLAAAIAPTRIGRNATFGRLPGITGQVSRMPYGAMRANIAGQAGANIYETPFEQRNLPRNKREELLEYLRANGAVGNSAPANNVPEKSSEESQESREKPTGNPKKTSEANESNVPSKSSDWSSASVAEALNRLSAKSDSNDKTAAPARSQAVGNNPTPESDISMVSALTGLSPEEAALILNSQEANNNAAPDLDLINFDLIAAQTGLSPEMIAVGLGISPDEVRMRMHGGA